MPHVIDVIDVTDVKRHISGHYCHVLTSDDAFKMHQYFILYTKIH